MFYKNQIKPGTLRVNQEVEGESIEKKVRRIMRTRVPITDGARDIFTERDAGVHPEYNPKTDRWEYVLDLIAAGEKAAAAAEVAKGQVHHDLDKPAESAKSDENGEGD